MKCEKCGKEFDYSYGSNRFCSRSCANSRDRPIELKEKLSQKLSGRRNPVSKETTAKQVATKKLKRESLKKDWACPHCGKILRLGPVEFKKRKYCSGTCRNLATNPFKNGTVSKAETLLGDLIEAHLDEKVDRNRRDLLDGLEIDIWIPSQKIGIEYNGIYHFEPIHGEEALQRIQEKDELKKELAEKKGYTLLIVKDLKGSEASVRKVFNELLEKLLKI